MKSQDILFVRTRISSMTETLLKNEQHIFTLVIRFVIC